MHYHARDMAIVRAHGAKIPVILSSATPSVETEVNARRNRYARLKLPERFGGQHLPHVEAIDMRTQGPARGRFIAPRLAEAIKLALEKKEQALLFLNRRGYAPLTLCRSCGYRLACQNCDAWLVDHRFKRRLVCHHCGFSMPQPKTCPQCSAVDSFAPVGPGVERLQEEAAALFPEARTIVLSSDLMESVERLREELDGVAAGQVRHHHRHATRGQGPSLPEAQSGRHRRCRSRACEWRSARGRAHLSAAASGVGARRPRGRAGPGLPADASARASGDARADFRRPRGVLRHRDRAARGDRLSAIRPARRADRVGRRQARDRRLCARSSRRRHRSTRACACWDRPKRRSRWCAGAIAIAC